MKMGTHLEIFVGSPVIPKTLTRALWVTVVKNLVRVTCLPVSYASEPVTETLFEASEPNHNPLVRRD